MPFPNRRAGVWVASGFHERNISNKRIRWPEIHIYRLRDGRIAEHWVEMSMLELLKQIGAI